MQAVHANLQQPASLKIMKEKTTSVRRISSLKEGLYKAIAEKRLNEYQ